MMITKLKMAPHGWINWRSSRSKKLIMEDLISGLLPYDEEECTAEEAWEHYYKHTVEFVEEDVQFSQFKARLKDHRKQVTENVIRARQDDVAVSYDRSLFPRKEKNDRGELVFDLHEAKKLLRHDVKRGRHLGKSPKQLRETRDEYKEFELKIFKGRIYQEIKYQKFVRYLQERRERGKFD